MNAERLARLAAACGADRSVEVGAGGQAFLAAVLLEAAVVLRARGGGVASTARLRRVLEARSEHGFEVWAGVGVLAGVWASLDQVADALPLPLLEDGRVEGAGVPSDELLRELDLPFVDGGVGARPVFPGVA